MSGYEWIGWKNDSRQTQPVEITFEFDSVRNFTGLHMYTNNFFTKDTQVFSRARVLFSVGGEHYHVQPAVEFEYVVDRIFEHARNVTIRLHNAAAKYHRLLSSLTEPCRCNMTEPAAHTDGGGGEGGTGFLVGGLVTSGVVFGVVPVALCILYYRLRLTKKTSKTSLSQENGVDSRKVSMKMKDLHINMNLSQLSNSYSRAKGNLYGHVAMDEEGAAMYQEPQGPIHNPGYHPGSSHPALRHDLRVLCLWILMTPWTMLYLMNVTPPPFSDVHHHLHLFH
ncbi:Discoidin domain-containing receptor 2-like 1 [Homarus americanus]|uniref:Discoidin domain-containing receptor 2-like 1 n=1 Tax=Homarus americanus TaxID=6706 RepID=A0A8J5MMM3_HOMAM|nr:Discoidin domain-containing receptor 2-like 1 [Homarus americanus]